MDLKTATRLADLRRAHGYSQEALAERLGLSRQAISKWERSESSPDTDNLIALADLYDMSLDDLLRAPAAASTTTSEEASAPTGDAPADAANAPSDGPTYYEADVIDDAQTTQDGDHVHIGLDGIHIEADDASVHIGRGGIHVHDHGPEGDRVDIGRGGIHVEEGREGGEHVHVDGKGVHVNDKDFDSVHEAREYYGVGTGNWFEKLPVFGICLLAYLAVGFLLGAWWSFWWFLLIVGVWGWIVDLVKGRGTERFWMDTVPVFWLCLLAFLACGFCWGAWHPAWLIFLLIPIWGGFAHAFRARRKQRQQASE